MGRAFSVGFCEDAQEVRAGIAVYDAAIMVLEIRSIGGISTETELICYDNSRWNPTRDTLVK